MLLYPKFSIWILQNKDAIDGDNSLHIFASFYFISMSNSSAYASDYAFVYV